jgi:hypothetical protein
MDHIGGYPKAWELLPKPGLSLDTTTPGPRGYLELPATTPNFAGVLGLDT